ncbi:sperm flagellar protein 1-like isoform X1 [Rattus norvegicus]|uniref:Sperm flagellar protein 1-like n=3 Tax=Rattus norvegicus TaxID=10116 RepID=D4A5G4_RAT|nr:sperm flagellar protein 1-like isoform X1 [Rattus norvegicus]|eukprot:XP_008758240.1 PREDICTED: sperm flagellar protein 1-like [Rattus norvegicus]
MLSASKQSSATFLPTPGDIHNLCAWLDRLPLSRPKRHLARDFSDGVLVAEIVKHFRPRLVDLHSYIPACSTDQKLSNWSLLNRKVFRKLHLCISDNDIQRVVSNRPGVIESILCALREKMEARTVQDPGHSGVDAVQPWGELTSHPHTTKIQDPNVDNCSLSEPLWDFCREDHYIPESWAHDDLELPNLHKKAGLQSPPAPSSTKILQNQRDLEKMGCCACRGDSIEGLWDHVVSIQQQLEDKEQALAILQETVKILQMKVMRLEHLVQLKDQRIWELMRTGPEEHQIWRSPHPESFRP